MSTKILAILQKYLLIFLIGIVLLGGILRYNNLYVWPRQGATFDEYAWAWQGINLIQKHVPISWSPHSQYHNKKLIYYQGTAFWLAKPYLEHPPLFGIVVGSFALLRGVSDMYHLQLQDIRPLALVLGLGSILLLFLLVRELYSDSVALLSALLYATIPTIVVGSRLVQNENFFIPLWLLSLFFTSRYIKTNKAWYLYVTGFICGLVCLAKIPWISASLSVVLLLIFYRKYSDVVKFLAIVIPILSLYFFYGIFYDAKLFFSLWGLQLNRYDLNFSSIYALFQKLYLVDRFYLDGWIYMGWFCLILLAGKEIKKHAFILIPIFSYFLIFLAGIPDEASHGWYRYPFYPFLVICIALFIKEYFAKNFFLTFLFLVFVGAALFHNTWTATFGFSYLVFRVAIIGWALTLLPIFFHSRTIIKTGKWLSFFWFASFILFNLWSVFLYNEM